MLTTNETHSGFGRNASRVCETGSEAMLLLTYIQTDEFRDKIGFYDLFYLCSHYSKEAGFQIYSVITPFVEVRVDNILSLDCWSRQYGSTCPNTLGFCLFNSFLLALTSSVELFYYCYFINCFQAGNHYIFSFFG